MTKYEFEAIGTHWVIDIKKELSSKEEALLLKKIKDRIEIFDKDYSRFRDDSLITQISKVSGEYSMPEDFEEMFLLYKKAYEITLGKVTPLIGNVLSDAGYDANYSLVKKDMTVPEKLEDVLVWNKPILTVKKPVILDFGACGKGYLVDIVSKIIEDFGVGEYCVDAGGDMRQRSLEDVLNVGLENPDDIESVLGIVKIQNQSLCGSAGNRRKWADMHHIIDPEKLTSPKHIRAIWTVADTTILADILTTCLFFVRPEVLKEHFKFDFFIVYEDFRIDKSDKLDAEIYLD